MTEQRKVPNRVTIFSNGIADFVRSYAAPKGKKTSISIPVKKDHVGDVLASLNLFGDVSLDSPPSFRPSNDLDGDLTISGSNVLEDLATQLSGAKVTATAYSKEPVIGTLVGVAVEQYATQGEKVNNKYLVILTSGGLQRVALNQLQNLYFQDESVQSEIQKALQRNFQQVKPNSTFVDLSICGKNENSEAIVQYTVPAAAWKISYRLNSNADVVDFKGLAIVDNNTDEDWKDVIVSVVTGEPITFSTDLADSKIPARSHVDIVKDRALGSVEVEWGNVPSVITTNSPGQALGRGVMRSKAMPTVQCASFSGGSPMMDAESFCPTDSAIEAQTEVKEIGDFCIFASENPVTIAANRSAVIPVFDTKLNGTKTVLHYKKNNHPERPFRSIQFKNETEHALGRGVVTLYQDGIYSGSAVLPATKQGEEQLLPYALETGVRVVATEKQDKLHTLSNVKLNKGVAISENLMVSTTKYKVSNTKSEPFEMYLDYNDSFSGSTVETTLDKEKIVSSKTLKNGRRYSFIVRPNSTITLLVTETLVQSSSMELGFSNLQYFFNTFVYNDGPLKDYDALVEIVDLYGKISQFNEKVRIATEQVTKLSTKQERLRKNIAVPGADDQSASWRKELGEAETKITDIEDKEIPQYKEEVAKLQKQIDKQLKKLSFSWKA